MPKKTIRSGAALAAVLLGLTGVLPATAQEQPAVQRTPEGAHRFLLQVLTNGSAYFNTIGDAGYNADWARITSYSGAGCYSTIIALGNDGKTKYRNIYWAKATSVVPHIGGLFMGDRYPVVDVNVPIKLNDGTIIEYIRFQVDGALMYRLGEAAEFLRAQCDKTSGTGF